MIDRENNIVPISSGIEVSIPDTVNQDIIMVLEVWLEAARKGELKEILIATVNTNRSITTAWTGSASINDCLAAAAGLFSRVQVEWVNGVAQVK